MGSARCVRVTATRSASSFTTQHKYLCLPCESPRALPSMNSRFPLQECAPTLDTPPVARYIPVIANDTVTGNGNRDVVGSAGTGHRTDRLGSPDPARNVGVADRF